MAIGALIAWWFGARVLPPPDGVVRLIDETSDVNLLPRPAPRTPALAEAAFPGPASGAASRSSSARCPASATPPLTQSVLPCGKSVRG
jgi:hypothetical protein